jgi:mRNA-degrading endonuclease RelE of RelBE toxin-antitoxin system
MKFTVETSPNFVRALKPLSKKYHSLEFDVAALRIELSNNPDMGTPIGGGMRKIRMSVKSKHRGKSGSMRVITLVKFVAEKVTLLTIYDKADVENLTKSQWNELKQIITSEK